MDRLDDYRDEMDALSSEDVEAVLSGRVPAGPSAARAAALVADLRQALREDPAPEVARHHVATLLSAAEGSRPAGRMGSGRRSRRRVGGVALAAALVIGGGAAAAVIQTDDPPPEARRVPAVADPAATDASTQGREAISGEMGVAPDASAHGRAVRSAAQDPTMEGCEKGQAVAGVASSNAAEHRQNTGGPPDPCARGQQDGNGGGNDGGDGPSAFGQGTAENAKAGGRDFGQEQANQAQSGDLGQQTASQVSGGAGGVGSQGGLPENAGRPPGIPGSPTGGKP
jgi:hypothetical protein